MGRTKMSHHGESGAGWAIYGTKNIGQLEDQSGVAMGNANLHLSGLVFTRCDMAGSGQKQGDTGHGRKGS